MSTHRYFDRICCVVIAVTLILTVLFMHAEDFGIKRASTVMGYEKALFDKSTVHNIDIIMDNWDEFTDNCKSEEYYVCTVVIDNEAYKNVAIRGKGNTSLNMVTNDRYSYKIEFDHYDSTKTYHGLDKLCLNNIIQDNTYMKDYLTYCMMNEIGAASPLCSYAYITVNGEDWGLYLAVEGVEESFLQRNYGKNYGELYKPDSTNMGGGRGNGEKFDFNEFSDNAEPKADNGGSNNERIQSDGENAAQITNENQVGDKNNRRPDDFGERQTTNGERMEFGKAQITDGEAASSTDGNNADLAETEKFNKTGVKNMQNGSDDVLLKYIDDNTESYANIFDNAKTDITDDDKARLIKALKNLSEGVDLEETVNFDAVIRYFAVHNFVLNFDSYTGSMIHNYYLYENNGQLLMIPWDYNLAFGGFQSTDNATSLVNYPIDSPVSGGDISDRPMIAWIFENEQYTELYHKYLSDFISDYFDSGYFENMIDNINTMISPYVEKDPTKFCTYDEFKTGMSTLKEFCLLRAKSVKGQLDGAIGSSADTQSEDTFIAADNIKISDMGNMNEKGNLGNADFNLPEQNYSEKYDTEEGSLVKDTPILQMPDGLDNEQKQDTTPPDFTLNGSGKAEGTGKIAQPPDNGNEKSDSNQVQSKNEATATKPSIILIGASVLILALGIVFACNFKRHT